MPCLMGALNGDRPVSFMPSIRFEPPPVYFLHIPKTAGVSVQQLLFSAYAPQKARRIDAQHLYQVDSASIRSLQCISSHLGPGLLPFMQQVDLVCITFLRNPVERLISNIYFTQQQMSRYPKAFDPAVLAEHQPFLKADLRTWVDRFGVKENGNLQTLILGRMLDVRPYFRDGEIGRLGQPLLRPARIPSQSEDHDFKQVAERAHQRLESTAVVGITERFAESIQLVCANLGIPQPKHPPKVNIGPHQRRRTGGYYETVPPDLIERLEAASQFDLELYAHVCDLFADRLARCQEHPRRTISIGPHLRMARRQAKHAARQLERKLSAATNLPKPNKSP